MAEPAIPLEEIPEDAQVVRVVVEDNNLDPDRWIAVTPPRNPRLSTLDEVVGHTDPVLIDWAVALAFRASGRSCTRWCRRDPRIPDPRRPRILLRRQLVAELGRGRGPLLWTTQTVEAVTVLTYLDHDWS